MNIEIANRLVLTAVIRGPRYRRHIRRKTGRKRKQGKQGI